MLNNFSQNLQVQVTKVENNCQSNLQLANFFDKNALYSIQEAKGIK
jgi:hypothetical protein